MNLYNHVQPTLHDPWGCGSLELPQDGVYVGPHAFGDAEGQKKEQA